MLFDRKADLGDIFNADLHIISYIKDTLSTYFRRAMKKAGINKPAVF
jgi:hypothetical protein